MKPLWALPLLVCAGGALADPPPVARAAVVQRAEATFDKADANHDGWLTKVEYQAAILAIAHRYDAKVTPQGLAVALAQFDQIDTGHVGRVSRAQFIAAAVGHFDSADLNHDGIVTPDEARKAAKIQAKAAQRARSPETGG